MRVVRIIADLEPQTLVEPPKRSPLVIAVKRVGDGAMRLALPPALFLLLLLLFPASASAQAQSPPPIYFTRNFDFEDVDINAVATRLRSFGIPVPVALEGTATVNLSVGIPLNRLASGRAYRFQGTLTSPRLSIEGYLFGDVNATLALENGVLTLPRLEGEFLDAEAPNVSLGGFAGEAAAALLPLEDFEATLTVQNIDVRLVDQFIEESIGDLRGTIDGVVTLTAPVQELGAAEAYTATARLSSPSLSYAGLILVDATANVRVDRGTAHVTSLAGRLAEAGTDTPRGVVRGEATAELVPLGEITVRGGVEGLDLALLPRLAEASELQIVGRADLDLTATAPIRTADEIASWSGDGRLSVGRTVIAERTVESAEMAFKLAETTFTADPVTLIAEGVPLLGRWTVRMADTEEQDRGWSANLGTEAAEVTDLLTLLIGAAPSGSTGTVSFDVDASGTLDGAQWQADAALAGSSVHIAGFRVGSLAHRLEVTPESLSLTPTAEADPGDLLVRRLKASYTASEDAVSLEDLSVEGWNGQLHGQAHWSLRDEGRHRAEFDWSDFQFVFRGDAFGAAERTFQTTTSGHIDWTAPASALSRPAEHTFHLRAAADDLRSGEVALGALDVTIDAEDAPWQLRGSGRLLDIPTEVSATWRVLPDVSWENLLLSPGRASLQAGPVAIDRMIARGSALVADEQAIAADPESPWQGTATLRINAATSPAGNLQSDALLSIDDLAYGDSPVAEEATMAMQLEMAEGRLRLSEVRGQLLNEARPGWPLRFSGLAVAELSPPDGRAPPGDLALEVHAPAIDLALLNPWLPAEFRPLAGSAAVTLRAAAPLDQLGELEAWMGVADVDIADLRTADRHIEHANAEVILQDGWIAAPQFELITGGVALGGRAAAKYEPAISSVGRWEANLQTHGARVEEVISLIGGTVPDETDGTIGFALDASGNLDQGTWRIEGDVSGDAIQVAGFDLGSLSHELRISPTKLELTPRPTADMEVLRLARLDATYSVDERQWTLDDFRLDGWGGTLAGTATWSHTDREPHRAEFSWADLQLSVPGSFVGLGDTVVQTSTVGTLEWSAPPAELADPAAHRFTLEAGMREMRLADLALGDLRINVDATDEVWRIEGDGTVLQGPAQLSATVRAGDATSWDQLPAAPIEATWVAGPMHIGRLFQLWQPEERAEDWTGQASLQWTAESDGDAPLRSSAQLSIEGLAYRNQLITDRLRVELASIGSRFDIRSVRGTYAGGRINASGRWSLDQGPRQLALRLSAVDASRALLPLTPESSEWFRGLMSADLVIAGGDSLRITGPMELRNGATFGVRSRSVRATVRGVVALPSLRWSLQLSNLRAFQGRGRVTGTVRMEQSLSRPNRIDLDSSFEATDLDFQEVLADQTGSASSLGHGSLTGTLDLRGRAIESFADVEGRLLARLGGTDAAAVPGLLSAQNYLGVLSIRNTRFTRGEIDARLRRGEMRIVEFWLSSDQLRVWADGMISLRSGRLDVQAVAATGNFRENNAVLLALAQRFALDAAMPIGLVTRVNDLLSDRVVRLAINGTYTRPNVRVEPAATLTQNAARFFLREAAGLAVPGAGVGALSSDR